MEEGVGGWWPEAGSWRLEAGAKDQEPRSTAPTNPPTASGRPADQLT